LARSSTSTHSSTLSLHDALPIWLVKPADRERITSLALAPRDHPRHLQAPLGAPDVGIPCAAQHRGHRPRPVRADLDQDPPPLLQDRKTTRLNSSHDQTSYAVFCW